MASGSVPTFKFASTVTLAEDAIPVGRERLCLIVQRRWAEEIFLRRKRGELKNLKIPQIFHNKDVDIVEPGLGAFRKRVWGYVRFAPASILLGGVDSAMTHYDIHQVPREDLAGMVAGWTREDIHMWEIVSVHMFQEPYVITHRGRGVIYWGKADMVEKTAAEKEDETKVWLARAEAERLQQLEVKRQRLQAVALSEFGASHKEVLGDGFCFYRALCHELCVEETSTTMQMLAIAVWVCGQVLDGQGNEALDCSAEEYA